MEKGIIILGHHLNAVEITVLLAGLILFYTIGALIERYKYRELLNDAYKENHELRDKIFTLEFEIDSEK